VEDQPTADERSASLRATPAAVRFISQEPQLGPINWTPEMLAGISQVIIGGESGPGSRPFEIQWARNTIAQCKAAGVACFVKQLGSNPQASRDIWHNDQRIKARDEHEGPLVRLLLKDRKGGDLAEWPADLRVRMQAGDAWGALPNPKTAVE
jgi:protein gp37